VGNNPLPEGVAIPKSIIATLRDGTAPESIRHQCASGDLPGSPLEKIEILILLSADDNAEVSCQALHTLRHWNPQELDQVLSDPSTPSTVIDFVFDRLKVEQDVLHEAPPESPTSDAPVQRVARTSSFAPSSTEPVSGNSDPGEASKSETEEGVTSNKETIPRHETLLQRIARTAVPERVRLALTGNQEERRVLIRDPNRVVMRSVLQSPRLSDQEIESYAAMRDVKDEVLRIISQNRAFIKSPGVVRALVFNPRSPVDVSLPLIKLLKDRDLKLLTVDKGVPDTVRNSAARLYSTRTRRK
jgi:hypothetical protein